jgi:squalene cyclase
MIYSLLRRVGGARRRWHFVGGQCPPGILVILLVTTLVTSILGASINKSTSGLDQDHVVVDAQSERIIKGALKWLASRQNGNGSWSAGDADQHDVAMTGYVLMAFMSAGQLPDEGEYGKNVSNGVNFLLNAVKSNGFIQSGTTNKYMYGHGIASIALAEAYGQTKDSKIKQKLELAVQLIISCQNPEGGWRYPPRVADADLSVTVLQVTALRAAKNAGIDVPQATIDRAVRYVLSCADEASGGFCYQPRQRGPGFARTAAAIYSLQVCGKYDDPHIKRASEYLFNRKTDLQWFTYGNFYAAPALYMMGGKTWESWYSYISSILQKEVIRQGDIYYWEAKRDGGDGGIGPIMCTAVYTTILAMPYHYLPLYQR